jgi:N,N'-diacetyllegionaminate synthase
MNFKDSFLKKDNSTYFIAEIGINHNGNFDLAKKMIMKSKEAGAQAVKFQKRNIDILTDPNMEHSEPTGYLSQSENDFPSEEKAFGTWTYPDKRLEFSNEEYDDLIEFSNKNKIDFIISPWEEDSVNYIEKKNLKVVKLASIDTINYQFCEYIAEKGIPTIASIGMTNYDQISKTYEIFKERSCPLMFMHCTSAYPCPIEDKNLEVINVLKEIFDTDIGFSGHAIGIEGTLGAVALGARVIEKHVTLSRKMSGPDQSASLEFNELADLINYSNNMVKAMGSKFKKLEKSETTLKKVLNKSFITNKNFKEGEQFTSDSIRTVVTDVSSGISPEKYFKILNSKASKNILKDHILSSEDLLGM